MAIEAKNKAKTQANEEVSKLVAQEPAIGNKDMIPENVDDFAANLGDAAEDDSAFSKSTIGQFGQRKDKMYGIDGGADNERASADFGGARGGSYGSGFEEDEDAVMTADAVADDDDIFSGRYLKGGQNQGEDIEHSMRTKKYSPK